MGCIYNVIIYQSYQVFTNFQGYHTKAITEVIIPYINLETSSAKFDEKSQTYDVTESVEGLHYDLFLLIQKQLNFTATLHKSRLMLMASL